MRSYEAAPVRRVGGEVTVPGDKSISHRSLMLSGIADGVSAVSGFLPSEDCLATMAAMRDLGVTIERAGATGVRVQGRGLRGLRAPTHALDMGNAGTAMRLFTGLLAAQAFDSELIGDASLTKRPMERVAKPLREMGAVVRTTGGTPPIHISGGRTLQGIDYRQPVASAQVKSAILLAGLHAGTPTTVHSPAPSRDHTERMLESFGVRVVVGGADSTGGPTVTVYPPQRLTARNIEVPGDFSSAAFFIVAALLSADGAGLVIRNVGLNPSRTGLLDILRRMGGDITVEDERASGAEPVGDLYIRASALRGIEVPPALVPLSIDELPVLFIAASCAAGETVVTGAEELRVKESDRIAAMGAGLQVLGVDHEILPDGIRIAGKPHGAAFGGGQVDSCGDHRVAMSFSVASVRAAKPIRICDVANVSTSFPGFVTLARAVGLELHEL